ncbi:hypothetical protein CWATWH8502_761 [Crocosphaera watsonii WH 8502]|uniref:Uncharacterized protein n=3 Tax=Crocosphaera watsonii TaxID=263511 RepID=T2JTW2_CROWT|nr:hypothetical protein CWATWH8502_761 [Crocosphaera watsonii WH 8502]CCQ54706.1 hypothetical protein CWATWH0005_5457 [Crocosphaera watsonii WH 0005]CCQ68466.1 hypothetical protein CWATWH0402_3056 [Crocosphaera watsonii WH 0402]
MDFRRVIGDLPKFAFLPLLIVKKLWIIPIILCYLQEK